MNNNKLTVSYRNKFTRTNEEDGSVYNVYCYLVSKRNNPLAIAQLEEDIKAAGHNVIVDEESGCVLFKSTRIIPKGCDIIRTSKGKWIADTQKWDEINALDKLYPNLGLGRALAEQLLADINKKDRTRLVEEEPESQEPEGKTEGTDSGDAGIDPFNL
jgi:hypothetical protein